MRQHPRLTRCGAAALAVILLSGSDLFAQAASFEELQKVLTPGDRIVVTSGVNDTATGRLVDVSGSTITLMLADKTSKIFHAGEVSAITRKDRLSNGAATGFGGGLAAATIPLVWIGYVCHHEGGMVDCLPAMAGIGLLFGGVGAAIGAAVDALRVETVYRRSNISIQPVFTVSPRGASAGIVFSAGRPR